MNRRSDCPIACTLDILGDKWTLLLLRDMVLFKKSRFDEFLESPEKISTNILTDRLHKMERAGLIAKETYSSHRQRFEYKATEQGEELQTILRAIGAWGLKNCENTKTREQILAEMENAQNN